MMKNFSPQERKLALALGLIVFLIINLIFLPQLLTYNKAAKKKRSELQAQIAAAKDWVEQKAYWTQRKEWLEKTEPSVNTAREDSAAQFEELQAAARHHGLTITEVQLLQLDSTEFYQPVGARFVASGPWPGLVKFISGLQNPQLFNVIPRFSVRSADPPPNVTCELEIQHWLSSSVKETP